MQKECLNSKETAAYLGICETVVLKQLRAGLIPSLRLGRRYLVPKSALDRWIIDQLKSGR